MNRRLTKIALTVGAGVVLVLVAAAVARATGIWDDGDSQLSGPQAAHAKRAALAITHGGHVNSVERDSEKGATYEVEVTRPDGTTVDVRLNERFGLVAVDGDSESSDSGGG